jgi:hypothetical protein
MKNSQSNDKKYLFCGSVIMLLIGISFLIPSMCYSLSTNFDKNPSGEKGWYEKDSTDGAGQTGGSGDTAKKKTGAKRSPGYYNSVVGTIAIGGKFDQFNLPANRLSKLVFDPKMTKTLSAASISKVKQLEHPLYGTIHFKIAVEPSSAAYNKMTFSKKIDFLYGDMQLADAVKYGIADIDKISALSEKKLGLGVGLVETIRKNRIQAGLTDDYFNTNFNIDGDRINAITYLIRNDILVAVEAIRQKGGEWRNGSPTSRKRLLMQEIIIAAAQRVH